MNRPKYSPGPWSPGAFSECGQYIDFYDLENQHHVIVAEALPDHDQDFMANARLISQAPTMFEFIVKLKHYLTYMPVHELIQKIDAIIEKVQGANF